MGRGVEVGEEREPVNPLKSQERVLLLKRQELTNPTNIPSKTPISNTYNTKKNKLNNHPTLQQRPTPNPLPHNKVKDWIQLPILPKQNTKTRKAQSMCIS